MTLALMEKDGLAPIYVDSGLVTEHLALGWHVAAIEYSSAQRLLIPYGCALDFVLGLLKLNGVAVTAKAEEINSLASPAVAGLALLAVRQYQLAPDLGTATYVHAAIQLGAAAQDITTGITDPDFARTLTVKGNVSGITGNVVLTLANVDGDEITNTIALNGTGEVEGTKAAALVTNIHVPAQTHTPTAQVETATVAATGRKQVETATVIGTITPVTGSGDATVIVTCTGMTGTPKTIPVAVLASDSASVVAGKIITELGLDADVTALFDVSGSGADVVLTRKTFAADISNLNISIANGTCTGLTAAPTSTPTAVGVAVNTIGGSGNASVIVTAAGMSGTPKTILVAVLAGDTVDQVADKIRVALALDAAVIARFTVSGATNKIILTRLVADADDTSLNIALADGTCSGITTAGSSANTTGGIAYDTVSVGVGNKFGMPQIIYNTAFLLLKLFGGSTDSGTLAIDADEVEKNIFSINGTPDGSTLLDLVYMA